MAGELFTLPLRLGVRWTQLMFRTAEGVAGVAIRIAGEAVRSVTPGGSDAGPAPDARPRPADETAVQDRVTPVVPPDAAPPRTEEIGGRQAPPDDVRQAPPEPDPAAQPAHVSEEPELVREEAESGAEEGAGADVTVIEPWQGYERMTAQEVIDRLADASPAELATVRLYESGKRSRQTVLTAVDRELKRQTGRGRPGVDKEQGDG
jgi:hypothetical protein